MLLYFTAFSWCCISVVVYCMFLRCCTNVKICKWFCRRFACKAQLQMSSYICHNFPKLIILKAWEGFLFKLSANKYPAQQNLLASLLKHVALVQMNYVQVIFHCIPSHIHDMGHVHPEWRHVCFHFHVPAESISSHLVEFIHLTDDGCQGSGRLALCPFCHGPLCSSKGLIA